jgi:oxygen-independent coproporphyrinogen III oxidase
MQPIESIYIHWPFCTSKCYYCDFVALEQHSDFQDAYHEALLQEIRVYAAGLSSKPAIKTIFIGGGTPSLYPPEKLNELFGLLRDLFDLSQKTEITLEANPADITEDRADAWELAGINRISCGVQVLDDAVLQRLNRRQRIIDVQNAAKILPKYFSNISMDLIIGLPGVSDATWLHTIETLSEWQIQHISIYFLTVHEKTPLYFKVARGDLVLPDEDALLDLYNKTVAYVQTKGFLQYEISNFSHPGFESKHNVGYWNRVPYKGFGIGAASFDGATRTVNDKNLSRYLTNSSAGLFPPSEQETLTPQQVALERLMLNLRQANGMLLHDMIYCLGKDREKTLTESLLKMQEAGLLRIDNERVKLTLQGMILENEVVLQLI